MEYNGIEYTGRIRSFKDLELNTQDLIDDMLDVIDEHGPEEACRKFLETSLEYAEDLSNHVQLNPDGLPQGYFGRRFRQYLDFLTKEV